MPEQRVVLEHEADIALLHGELQRVLAVEQHAARGRHVEAGENAQQRGLARARRPEQRHELAGGNIERHPVQRRRRAERPDDVLDRHVNGLVPVRLCHASRPVR